MWFRKTHLMSKKPCELFYKPFFFEPGSCFLPRVNGTSTRKESVLFGILDPQSWWELMSKGGGALIQIEWTFLFLLYYLFKWLEKIFSPLINSGKIHLTFLKTVENVRMNFISGCSIVMCSDHCPLMCLLVMSNQGSRVLFISEALTRSDSKRCLDWPSFCIKRKKKASA